MRDHAHDEVKQFVADAILRQLHNAAAEFPVGILAGPAAPNATTAWTTSSTSATATMTTADLLAAMDEMKRRVPPPSNEAIFCWRGTSAELFRQLEGAGAWPQPIPGQPGPLPYWTPWNIPPLYGLVVEQHGDHVLIGTADQLAEANEKGEEWIQAQIRRSERLWGLDRAGGGREGRTGDFSRFP